MDRARINTSFPCTKGRLIALSLLLLSCFDVSSVLALENLGTPMDLAARAGMEEPSVNPSRRDAEPPPPFLGAISVLFDNDSFSGNDSRYTGGLSLAWTSAAAETYRKRHLHRKIVNAFSFLPTVGATGYHNYLQFVVGMEAYTATDIRLADPPPGDHPYAGILYLDSTIMSRTRVANHQLTLRLGFVGPASGASEVQRWIHEIIGSPTPEGWDTQLENEPIVNLYYQYSRRLLRSAPADGGGVDIACNGGAGLGNYYIGANAGVTGRAGYRLPGNYGVTPLMGGAESMVGLPPPRKKFCVYGFISSQAFGIARWLPTDGNTFVDSRSGDRDTWFASLSAGIVMGFSRVIVSYRYHGIAGLTDPENFRTRNRDDFGTIMMTVFLG